jgi:hypothetical protein
MGMLKVHWRKEEDKELISAPTISKQIMERQEGRERVGDKPLPEAGQVADHRAHLSL